MKLSTLKNRLPVFIIICALSLTASSAFSQGKGKAKAKGKNKIEAKENHGREAGELPVGLISHTDKKGGLPSGVQKKEEEGQLPRGLQEGGKKLKSSSKGKTSFK